MAFVVDCSVVLKWFFTAEATPGTAALLDATRSEVALVPSIWPLEVGNVLLGAERRGQRTVADSDRFVELLRTLRIEVDHAGFDRSLRTTLEIARSHRLSAYDASYLELARRVGVPIASLDGDLVAGAKAMKVEVLAL